MIQHSVFLEGKLTFQDMRLFFFYGLRKSVIFYFIFIFLVSVFVFSVEGLPITVYYSETLELLFNGILMTVISLILTLLFIGVYYIRLTAGYRKNERIKQKRNYTINPQGIQIQSKNSYMLFEWHEVTAVAEYKRLFYIKTSSGQLILIPKRFFAFDQELHSFRQLVTEYGRPEKVKWQS